METNQASLPLTNTRSKSIDVAKGIGMLLVIAGHVSYHEMSMTVLYSFHLPLFFILSGLLFRRERYPRFRDFLKRRIQTLLLPYLLFAVLSVLWVAFTRLLLQEPAGEVLQGLLKSLPELLLARYSQTMTFNIPLWFVPCLFAVECGYYWLNKLKCRPLFFAVLLCVIAFGWYSESAYCPADFSILPWNFSGACFAIGFYALGNLFAGLYGKLNAATERSGKRVLIELAAAAACLAVLTPLALLNGYTSVGSRILGNGFLFYLTSVLGAVAVLLLANVLQGSRFLQFIGKNSFTVMATHELLHMTVIRFYRHFTGETGRELYQKPLTVLLMFLVVSILSLSVTFVYSRLICKIKAARSKAGCL